MNESPNYSLKNLRILSYTEGVSLLILLFIAMPIKYGLGEPRVVSVVGMLHGLLFMALVAMILIVGKARRLSKTLIVTGLISSSIPFGMLYFDKKLKEFDSKH